MMVNGSSMVDTTVGEAKKVLERALRDHRVGCLLSICTSVCFSIKSNTLQFGRSCDLVIIQHQLTVLSPSNEQQTSI